MSTFRWASETIRARRRRADATGHRGGARLADRAAPPVPDRPGARDHAVQLPAEPGGAQGRARARGRRADRRQARLVHADRLAAARRSSSPRRTCRRACTRCCRSARRSPTAWRATTGSGRSRSRARREIGWYLKGLDPKKRVTLELGGNAGVIVHSDADLDHAAARIAFGGYYQAGQSCISVQRVLVASEVYDDFAARLVEAGREPEGRRPDGPDGRRRPGDRPRARSRGSRSGSRKPSRRAPRCSPAGPARARSSSRRCSSQRRPR